MDNSPLSSPASSPDGLPTPDNADESKPLNLTPEQLDALGLADCAPGEAYTVEIKCTGNDPETGPSFDATGPAEPSEGGDEAELPNEPESESVAEPESGADEEDGNPFVKRKKKEPREGLPSTKNMRDI